MKRKRGLLGWCGLGLAVAAVAGGAYAGKRYAEQNMLASMLGSGVRAQSVQWHWRQAAGCAEQVEIPLDNAKDSHDQALQLYAPKLWFVYDQAALLRKRFILPRVVIEDAVISTSSDRALSGEIVDVDFGPGVDLGDLVELPSVTESDPQLVSTSQHTLAVTEPALQFVSKPSGLAMPWLDQLQTLYESVLSDKSIRGRQVAIDADMLGERMQDFFGDRRSQAQRLVSEARDIQLQLSSMDNVLRQPQLQEVVRRLEQIKEQMFKLKKDIQSSGKLLDDQQSRVLSALLIEKKQLIQQADDYQAPTGNELSAVVLAQLVKDQLGQPARAVILLADVMRKPLDVSSLERGQSVRYLDPQQPEFAARSAKISGKLEIDGLAWPFSAEGKFELFSGVDDGADVELDKPEQTASSGNAQWRMHIQAQPQSWELEGECPRLDGPCSITLSTAKSNDLRMVCKVERAEVSGAGQLDLRHLLSLTDASGSDASPARMAMLAAGYRAEPLLRKMMSQALVIDDQTPEKLGFEVQQLPAISDCQLADPAIDWLGTRLQAVATSFMSDAYRQAAVQLEGVIASKLSDQKGMTATLRNDTEQFISAQLEEMRRIQATVNSLMEQQQPNYFARQPGDIAR